MRIIMIKVFNEIVVGYAIISHTIFDHDLVAMISIKYNDIERDLKSQ